jgi:hypothetical protein
MKQDLGTTNTGEESERRGRYVETYRLKAMHRRARKTKQPLLRRSMGSIFSFQTISVASLSSSRPYSLHE